MILPRVCILLPAFLLVHARGLPQTALTVYAQKVVKQLRAGSNDTIVTFEPFQFNKYFFPDTLANIGEASVAGNVYILYRKAGKTLFVKCVEYNPVKEKNFAGFRFRRSQPVEVKGDTLYNWIKACLPDLNYARLLPFIYQADVSTDSLSAYNVEAPLHDSYYNLDIYTANHIFRAGVQQIEMRRTLFEDKPSVDSVIHKVNLNYAYNSNTKLFRAITNFKALVSQYDRYFRFER